MRNSAPLFIGLGILILAGLFFLLKPVADTGKQASSLSASVTNTPQKIDTSIAKTYELVVENGQLVSGPAMIRVYEGDEVIFVVSSDRSDELHLHGYDLHAHLHPGKPSTISFLADHTGRFEFELHEANRVLGTLEVLPR